MWEQFINITVNHYTVAQEHLQNTPELKHEPTWPQAILTTRTEERRVGKECRTRGES